MKKFAKVLAVLSIAAVATAGVAAISACNSGETYNGDYHYANSPGEGNYGIKVKVTVSDGKITKVEKVDSDYIECSAVNENLNWTQAKVDNWNNKLPELLKSYEGKTVEEVLAMTSSIKGVDGATTNSVSDDSLVITDATQGSARVLKAVQDAIKDIK